jgi:aspartyl/asparaginyl beta-hydroxylase (cupin superfamily)
MLVRLLPGGRVTPHTDIGIYADATERFHLPLVTTESAWLAADGERYHLAPGRWYALDKHLEHEAGNDGKEPRVHMIVDIVPDSPEVLAG